MTQAREQERIAALRRTLPERMPEAPLYCVTCAHLWPYVHYLTDEILLHVVRGHRLVWEIAQETTEHGLSEAPALSFDAWTRERGRQLTAA